VSIVRYGGRVGVIAKVRRPAPRASRGSFQRKVPPALVITRDFLDDREVLILGERGIRVVLLNEFVERPGRLGVRTGETFHVAQTRLAELVERDDLFLAAGIAVEHMKEETATLARFETATAFVADDSVGLSHGVHGTASTRIW
jgi:hypothetical protein